MRRAAGIAAALAAVLAATPLRAQRLVSREATAAAGSYQLANDSGTRACILLLRAIPVAGGMAIGFPVHCKATLPLLGRIAAWSLEPGQSGQRALIRFHAENGDILLDFTDDGTSGSSLARSGTGETYALTPRDGRSLATRIDGAPPARKAETPTGPSTKPTAADTPRMAGIAGFYRLARGKRSFNGCRLTLEAPSGNEGPAALDADCHDKGAVFFSPARWTLSDGTLWLLNKRGQKLSFERSRNGDWVKGAGQGEPLSLIRD